MSIASHHPPTSTPSLTLQIKGFPASVLDALEQMAASASPRTTRNSLIEHVLTEYAAGRLAPVANLETREAA